jgi:hypothetical protein
MVTEDINNKEFTMDMGIVNLIAIVLIIPIAVVSILPFIVFWGFETFSMGWEIFRSWILLFLLFGIVVHELLHGVTWSFFAEGGFKTIKFGVNWKFLTPYCHCNVPLKVKHYAIGGAMPLVVMGIIPILLALAIGNGGLHCFGVFFTWAAGGDIVALFMLRKLNRNSYVSDHPEKMGFYINTSSNMD